MSFVSPEFVVFFLVVFVLHFAWINREWQNGLIFVASWTPPKTSWFAREYDSLREWRIRGRAMRGQAGFFEVDERLKELSAKGDALERLNAIVDFEAFRPDLAQAVPRSDGSKGGRPAFDHVFMWKILILQASHSLSDERTEFLIKDRLSFMRFLELGLSDAVPDANTIWTFREALTRATIDGKPAIEMLFRAYEASLAQAGFLAMGGQIIDASIVAAPKQHNTAGEKADLKAGRIPEAWKDEPAKLAQKDRDARWTVKFSKAKPSDDGSPRIDLAVPAFGYKNHIGIDRRHGLIRTWAATNAARHDGAQLSNLVSKANTASDLWADTAYRSKANEKHLADNGLRSQIHRKKPPGRPMPLNVARANGAKSKVRSAVEHVFAHQKGPMGLVVRTIGLARATVKIGLANIVYNMRRAVWLTQHRMVPT
jgi:transposase, IS5 family